MTLAIEHDLASMYAGEIVEDIWRACCMETGCDPTRDVTQAERHGQVTSEIGGLSSWRERQGRRRSAVVRRCRVHRAVR